MFCLGGYYWMVGCMQSYHTQQTTAFFFCSSYVQMCLASRFYIPSKRQHQLSFSTSIFYFSDRYTISMHRRITLHFFFHMSYVFIVRYTVWLVSVGVWTAKGCIRCRLCPMHVLQGCYLATMVVEGHEQTSRSLDQKIAIPSLIVTPSPQIPSHDLLSSPWEKQTGSISHDPNRQT